LPSIFIKITEARLIALIRDGNPEQITSDIIYSPARLFPETVSAFSSQFHFVLPVMYQDNKLGYVIFEQVEGLQTLYITLTRELAKNYYISKLIKKRKDTEESLKILAANLEFRNKELEDFTHIASHDLKEPLRKISFFGDKLKKTISGKMNEEELDSLMRMQHAASRMEELIEGLLAYSRITTKQQPFVRINLNTIISEVLQDLEIRIAESKGVVQVGELPFVNADPLQMRQLFQNLIGNALKYHAKDVAPLVVIASTVEGETCKISVSDNGIGFEQSESGRIFGIFERLVGKSEYEGTGVGLAICKKIVEHHGGTINAFGEPGKGARFVIIMRYSGLPQRH
jgi:light-regulated signal transduction histidine kinase (bacteriophytochrome)